MGQHPGVLALTSRYDVGCSTPMVRGKVYGYTFLCIGKGSDLLHDGVRTRIK